MSGVDPREEALLAKLSLRERAAFERARAKRKRGKRRDQMANVPGLSNPLTKAENDVADAFEDRNEAARAKFVDPYAAVDKARERREQQYHAEVEKHSIAEVSEARLALEDELDKSEELGKRLDAALAKLRDAQPKPRPALAVVKTEKPEVVEIKKSRSMTLGDIVRAKRAGRW